MIPNFIYFQHKKLAADIGTIRPGNTYPFYSDGKWSNHELFLYLLGLAGQSKVDLATFSISEASIRSFASAIGDGLISEFNCILDHTVKKNKLELLFFANNIVNEITILPNHSKLLLIGNKDWKITVIGSANMTPNPRKEVGVIFTVPEIYTKYLAFFNLSKAQGNPVDFEFWDTLTKN